MAYGTLKCDNIVFDNGGVDKLLTVSGLFFSTSGALTVTGAISGGSVTAPTATFTTLTGTTTAGTTATFTSGSFTSLTGVTTTGTTANFVTHNGASGIFTSLVSGATITGTTANFTSGNFISLSGTTTTVTSGVFSAGSATAPSVAVGTGTSNSPGIYSPGTDQLAISTSGSGRLFVDANGNVGIGVTTPVDTNGYGKALDIRGSTTSNGGVIYLRNSDASVTGQIAVYGDGRMDFGTTTNHPLKFYTYNSEKMRLDSSGNLGLGVTPSAWNSGAKVFQASSNAVFGSYAGAMTIFQNAYVDSSGTTRYLTTGPANSYQNYSGLHAWFNATSGTAGNTIAFTQAMTLDASGRLGLGTSSPSEKLHVSGGNVLLQQGNYFIIPDGGGAYGAGNGSYIGNSGQNIQIQMRNSGDGVISFGIGATEAARIDTSRRLLVGTSTDGGAGGLTIYPIGSGAGSAAIGVWNKTNTALEAAAQFRVSATTIGSISYSNTLVAYNTTSDYRLKENVIAVTNGIARLQQLKPSRFNFIADPDHTVDGFLAHEAQAVVPECVTGDKDAVDEDGNPVYQGIDQSKLVPLLTAALQEALAKIEALETRLSALEAA